MTAAHFDNTAVVLTPSLQCDEVATDQPDFYGLLDREYGSFAGHVLISMHRFSNNWPTWEIHPNGDEIVCLLSGEAAFLLKESDEVRRVVLNSPGSYVKVPRDTWHTAHIEYEAVCLFITPGEGTENRESVV